MDDGYGQIDAYRSNPFKYSFANFYSRELLKKSALYLPAFFLSYNL